MSTSMPTIPSSNDRAIDRASAFIDIAIVFVVSAAAFGLELALGSTLPWGEEARGVLAVLAGAAAALVLTRGRGRAWADLGFRRPRRWSTVPLWALAILVVFIAAQVALPALLGGVFDLPPPDLSRYAFLHGNAMAAIGFALLLPLTAAIPEEIVYRGFLIERLNEGFGGGRHAPVLAVGVQALIFGSVHFQWGLGGMVLTTLMGAIWGVGYLLCGRNLWIVIIAHSLGHVLMVAQLYAMPVGG